MTLEQALNYIHGLYRKGATPGLGRISALLARLGDPQKGLKFVHIAGTNGKGSTAAMTANILVQAGYKTGLFTSPFIYRFNERIVLSGAQIPDADVVALVEQLRPLAEALEDRPTEFEFVTAMAMVWYARKKADIVVLEVGMGGEKDATNVIPAPEAAVICNIGLDHTDALGGTLPEIAGAKAGIIKAGCHTVAYRGPQEVEAVYRRVCQRLGCPLQLADFAGLRLRSCGLGGQEFDCGSRKGLRLPLLGDHQMHNAAVVLAVAEALRSRGWAISEEHIRQGLATVTWPGRFDIVGEKPLFIIDGGHNPQCIQALVKNVRDYLAGRRVIALVGVLADKDYGEMFRPMLPLVAEFVCVTPDNPRRLPAAELADHLRRTGARALACEDMGSGVALAREKAGEQGAVLCFGSLYSIGDIKAALDGLSPRGACNPGENGV